MVDTRCIRACGRRYRCSYLSPPRFVVDHVKVKKSGHFADENLRADF